MILASIADWLTVRTELTTLAVAAASSTIVGVTAKWWGKPLAELASSTFGLCRATRANTREIERVGVENAMLLDQNRIILDQFDVAYAYTDAKGKVIDVSDAWVAMSGCPREEAIAGNWTKYIEPKDAEHVTKRFFDNAKSPKPIAYVEDFTFIGSRAVIRATIDPIKRNGKVVGFRGINKVLIVDPYDDKTVGRSRTK